MSDGSENISGEQFDGSVGNRSQTEQEISTQNTMEVNFLNSSLVFTQEGVQALSDAESQRDKIAIAEQASKIPGVQISEGAKVLVFQENDLQRVIFQTINPPGSRGYDATTVLLDKESGEMKNVMRGYYLGPARN